ncbi:MULTISPECIES: hypothetical protein [unclassified Microbacterium]|uniref:hypothetical protein n=1 Tax=unclassified Microbacterium TaxID=2609290 RepID=UPI00214B03A0|nr:MULTISPECIES: hypothetical protein [unclassified Microbacterium]MCR2811402.1 hypothetical protein [Microbacterium sp. zg.B185]WIM19492.1 hypothetical protein QNO12_01390 [Microbacterium sp. zg-B185]
MVGLTRATAIDTAVAGIKVKKLVQTESRWPPLPGIRSWNLELPSSTHKLSDRGGSAILPESLMSSGSVQYRSPD